MRVCPVVDEESEEDEDEASLNGGTQVEQPLAATGGAGNADASALLGEASDDELEEIVETPLSGATEGAHSEKSWPFWIFLC